MWRKIIVLNDELFDCEHICERLTAQFIDVEVVSTASKFESALQWWHPEILIVNPWARAVDVATFLQGFGEGGTRIPVVVAAAAPDAVLENYTTRFSCVGYFSTLNGFRGIVARLREIYDRLYFDEDSGVGW